MIFYVETHKDSTERLLEQIKEFDKGIRYKINIQNSGASANIRYEILKSRNPIYNGIKKIPINNFLYQFLSSKSHIH